MIIANPADIIYTSVFFIGAAGICIALGAELNPRLSGFPASNKLKGERL